MAIFHCYVKLPEGKMNGSSLGSTRQLIPARSTGLRADSSCHRGMNLWVPLKCDCLTSKKGGSQMHDSYPLTIFGQKCRTFNFFHPQKWMELYWKKKRPKILQTPNSPPWGWRSAAPQGGGDFGWPPASDRSDNGDIFPMVFPWQIMVNHGKSSMVNHGDHI